MRNRRRLAARLLLAALLPAVLAAGFAPVASARSSVACARSLAAPNTPAQVEAGILKRFVAQGWTPTAAGAALLASGSLSTTVTATAVEPGASDVGSVILARGPVVRTTQKATHPSRRADQDHVFLYCGIGQRANITYTTTAASATYVGWYEENFQTGAARTRNGPSGACPPGGSCLVYAWDKPPAPWFVFDATVYSTGSAFIENAYCGG
jgi:hypothetical protein